MNFGWKKCTPIGGQEAQVELQTEITLDLLRKPAWRASIAGHVRKHSANKGFFSFLIGG